MDGLTIKGRDMKFLVKKIPLTHLLCLSLWIALPLNAQADEVWASDRGKIIYADDHDTTAIWTFNDEQQGSLFIDGLAGNWKTRSHYQGYWSQSEGSKRCDTFREGRDGKPTYYWGGFHIWFLKPDFPSGWVAVTGHCEETPKQPWVATPVTG